MGGMDFRKYHDGFGHRVARVAIEFVIDRRMLVRAVENEIDRGLETESGVEEVDRLAAQMTRKGVEVKVREYLMEDGSLTFGVEPLSTGFLSDPELIEAVEIAASRTISRLYPELDDLLDAAGIEVQRCQCEAEDHFEGGAHAYLSVADGSQSAAYVGGICDDCASTHAAPYLVTVGE